MNYELVTLPAYRAIGLKWEGTYSEVDHNGYMGLREADRVYFDPLPIKHEYYPLDRDPKDPHFDIYIPVVCIDS